MTEDASDPVNRDKKLRTPQRRGKSVMLVALGVIVGTAATLLVSRWIPGVSSVRLDPVLATLLGLLAFGVVTMWLWFPESHLSADFATRQLYFAASVLTGLGAIFLFSMMIYYSNPEESGAGAEIFDACLKTIPPIVTLVLGYYFGRRGERESARPEEP